MTTLLARVSARTAMALVAIGTVVLLAVVVWQVWLVQRVDSNDDADRQQTSEIAANQVRLDDVSALARDLKTGLTKANRRLRANGVEPVPVPTTPVEGQAGADGIDGTTGATGQRGNNGATGLPGATGSTGASGTTGAAGANGSTGATGQQGPKGDTGATGPQGPPGKDGADGTNGQDGAPGQPGAPGADGRPAASFTFTDALGITYTCTDPETDGDYTCRAA